MMPFYGHTPDEAVQLLSRWLTSITRGRSLRYSGAMRARLAR